MLAQSVQKTARRAIQGTSRTVGRLTAGTRMSPDFLIVGAKRCGTTSMYRTLTGHPQVLSAVLHKEVHYFDTGYQHGPRWYQAHFPTKAKAGVVQRRTGHPAVTGEATPYYMWHPLAPGRIAADLPDVRLVVLLRDPVQRAYSEHAHGVSAGVEDQPFEAALELEEERLAGEEARLITDPSYRSVHHAHHAYLRRGRYIEQLERIEALVGRDRIHVIDSDALFSEAGPAFEALVTFLGLQPWAPPSLHNLNARPRSAMSQALQARLAEEFAPYDERLASWLGWTPSWRLTGVT